MITAIVCDVTVRAPSLSGPYFTTSPHVEGRAVCRWLWRAQTRQSNWYVDATLSFRLTGVPPETLLTLPRNRPPVPVGCAGRPFALLGVPSSVLFGTTPLARFQLFPGQECRWMLLPVLFRPGGP